MESIIIFLIVIFFFWELLRRNKKSNSSYKYQHSNKPTVSISKSNLKRSGTPEEIFLNLVKLARKELDEKNFEKAIYYYDQAIEIDSSEYDCFNERTYCKLQIFENRGRAYWNVGRKDKAIKDWENAALLGSNKARNWLSQIGYYKKEWQEFENILIKEGINRLYHFTDRLNLDSIIQYGGIFSWYTCEKKGISIPVPGGNKLSRYLDIKKDIQDYVRLSFNKKHPMLYVAKNEGRILNPFFLEISPEVIFLKDTLFCDENANAKSAKIGSELEDFKKINFKIAKSGKWVNEIEKKYVQAEVMVKSYIPIKFIRNL